MLYRVVQLDWSWHPAGQIHGQLQIWAVIQPEYNRRTRRGQLRLVGDALMFILLAIHGSTLSVSLYPRLQNRAGSKRWQVRAVKLITRFPLDSYATLTGKTGVAWSPSIMRSISMQPPSSRRHVHQWQAASCCMSGKAQGCQLPRIQACSEACWLQCALFSKGSRPPQVSWNPEQGIHSALLAGPAQNMSTSSTHIFLQDALFNNRVALDLVLVGLSGLALLMLVCSMGYSGQVKARPQYTFYDSPFSTSPAHFLLAKKKGNSSLSTSTSSLQVDGAAWASMPGGPGRWTLQDDDEGALPGLQAH